MTLSMCDQVAERVALGESLGELAGHAETCKSCRDLIAMSSKLGAVRHSVDPGLGFTARMTVGAQHRIAARRRQRLAVGLAATVAAGGFGVFAVTHSASEAQQAIVTPKPPDPIAERPNKTGNESDNDNDNDKVETTPDEADLAALIQLADLDRSSRLSARWAHIRKPLAPYKKLLKGVTP